MYVDAHCHLADSRFDGVRDQVIQRARAAGVTRFAQGGVSPSDWERQETLDDGSWIRAYGLHPWWIADNDQNTCDLALDLLRQKINDAPLLGELGLDFQPRFESDTHQRQINFFKAQLDLARKVKKPIVLHVVRAHDQAFHILKDFAPLRGIVHAFGGSIESARAYLNLGLSLSVGGALTRPNRKKLRKAVIDIPLDRLLIESDAPDMPPQGFESDLNEPATIHQVAAEAAQLKQVTPEQILLQSRDNLDALIKSS